MPAEDTWKLTVEPSYFYYCANETIDGIEIDDIPAIVPKDVPIVCDMSSNFLTQTFDITKVTEKHSYLIFNHSFFFALSLRLFLLVLKRILV